MKHLLRYLKGTSSHGLAFYSLTPSLAYSDVGLASSIDERRFIGTYYVFLCTNLISWHTSKQNTASRSYTKSKYHAMASVTTTLLWLHSLFSELHLSFATPPTLYCDNQSS